MGTAQELSIYFGIKILPQCEIFDGNIAKRSTVTALTAMQKEWTKNCEEGLLTGVLIYVTSFINISY